MNSMGNGYTTKLYAWVDVNFNPWDTHSSLLNNTREKAYCYTGANSTGSMLIVSASSCLTDLRYTSYGNFNDKLKTVHYFIDKR